MVVLYKLQYNNTHKSELKDETKYDLCNIVPKKLTRSSATAEKQRVSCPHAGGYSYYSSHYKNFRLID